MLTSVTMQGAAVIKTDHLHHSMYYTVYATSHLLGGSLMDIMICFAYFNVSRHRCRLFADDNIALGILSKLSKQNDRSPTMQIFPDS